MKQAGVPFVVVLRHPDYYPRFGFEDASLLYGIKCAYENAPDEYFMIVILAGSVMKGTSGVTYYQQEFDMVTLGGYYSG